MRRSLRQSPATTTAIVSAMLLLAACKPQSAPTSTQTPAQPAAAQTAKAVASLPAEMAAPAPAAPSVPAPATPTAAAEAATATAAAAEATGTAAGLDASVAIYVDSGSPDAATPPQAGKPVTITVTPVDGNGRPLRKRQQILGQEIVLLAVRYDLSWVEAFGAKQLSEPGGLSHRFRLTIPTAGRHLLYFMVQAPGGPISVTPVDLKFRGAEVPAEDWGDDTTRVAGPKGMSIELKPDSVAFSTCMRRQIATSWVSKGKPVPLAGASDAAKVVYLAIPQTLAQPSIGQALRVGASMDTAKDSSATASPGAESAPPMGGDAGTDAWLTLKDQGKYKIVALAQLPAERGASPAGSLTAAVFAVTASGTPPEGGCP